MLSACYATQLFCGIGVSCLSFWLWIRCLLEKEKYTFPFGKSVERPRFSVFMGPRRCDVVIASLLGVDTFLRTETY